MKKKVQILLKKGKRYNTLIFRLHHKSSASYKIGFIANRKAGKASGRSHIKRIIREFCKANFETGDFFFVLKPGIEKTGRERIIRDLENTAARIKCEEP